MNIASVMERAQEAARAEFANDLNGMSDADIEAQIREVSETIDEETAWLEALTAEKAHRAKGGAA